MGYPSHANSSLSYSKLESKKFDLETERKISYEPLPEGYERRQKAAEFEAVILVYISTRQDDTAVADITHYNRCCSSVGQLMICRYLNVSGIFEALAIEFNVPGNIVSIHDLMMKDCSCVCGYSQFKTRLPNELSAIVITNPATMKIHWQIQQSGRTAYGQQH